MLIHRWQLVFCLLLFYLFFFYSLFQCFPFSFRQIWTHILALTSALVIKLITPLLFELMYGSEFGFHWGQKQHEEEQREHEKKTSYKLKTHVVPAGIEPRGSQRWRLRNWFVFCSKMLVFYSGIVYLCLQSDSTKVKRSFFLTVKFTYNLYFELGKKTNVVRLIDGLTDWLFDWLINCYK